MTEAVAGVPTLNPVTAQIPSFALAQLQAQRRMQMAQALTQQGLAPIDYDPKGHVSWTQGLAKMLSSAAGASMFNQAAKQEASLQTQGMQAMGAAYGMGQQPGAAPAGPSPQALGAALDPRASAALAQGAQQGSVGPTVDNGARMDAMPQPAAPAQPMQAQPAPAMPAAAGGAPLNPMGLPPMLLWQASQGDPAATEQIKTLLANRTLTPEQRNAQDPTIGASVRGNLLTQNMTPLQKLQAQRQQVPDGSLQAHQLDDAISKENYIAPIDAKPGTPLIDPRTGKPTFFAPKTADGIGMNFDDPLHPTAYALPGYGGANASIVAADQRAKTDNSVFSATGPGGEALTVRGSAVPGGGAPAAPAAPVAGAAPAQRQPVAPGAPAPAARLPGLAGPSITDKSSMKSGAAVIDNAPQQVAGSKAAITGLTQALGLVEGGIKTGAGQAKSVNALSLVNNLGIPLMKGDVDGYQTMQKYLQNSLNAAAQGTSAGGSDARFESFMHGQPNAETMNPAALSSAIRYVLSQHDATVARGNFIGAAYSQAKAAGDSNPALTAQQQWAGVYNPEYFRVGRLAPADQVKAVQAMSPADAQHFMQWRKSMGQFQ